MDEALRRRPTARRARKRLPAAVPRRLGARWPLPAHWSAGMRPPPRRTAPGRTLLRPQRPAGLRRAAAAAGAGAGAARCRRTLIVPIGRWRRRRRSHAGPAWRHRPGSTTAGVDAAIFAAVGAGPPGAPPPPANGAGHPEGHARCSSAALRGRRGAREGETADAEDWLLSSSVPLRSVQRCPPLQRSGLASALTDTYFRPKGGACQSKSQNQTIDTAAQKLLIPIKKVSGARSFKIYPSKI